MTQTAHIIAEGTELASGAPPRAGVSLAHISDVHFGRIANPAVVPALITEVNTVGIDLVALSGDLTQRARTEQFQAARGMIDAFEPPVIVVPGNHDVPAWWRPFSRLFRTIHRYRTHVTDDLTPSCTLCGVAVFGLNSAHGLTIKGGYIRPDDLETMQRFFAAQPPDTFRVVVVHHHLKRIQALGPHDVAIGAKRALRAIADCGVELLLCGHLHRSHVEHVDVVPEHGHRVVIASAGTATSSRGRERGGRRKVNFYNHVHVYGDHFVVEERRYDPDGNRFDTVRETRFERIAPAVPQTAG
jgi:3',5'-cyclic AMP phosphodiesterase CpdA